MPSLPEFPNEILYKIIDQIHPDDIINFSLSLKHFHAVSKDAVSLHMQRKKTYIKHLLHGCHRHLEDSHPLRLIRDICMDWRIGEYVYWLAFACCYRRIEPEVLEAEGVSDIDYEDTEYKGVKREDDAFINTTMDVIQGYIEEKAAKSGFMLPTRFDVQGLCNDIRRGDRGPMLAILLLFIPNLEILYLDESTYVSFRLDDVIHTMCEQYPREDSQSPKPLMKLSLVRFVGDRDGRLGEDFQLFIPFAALPSVRILRGDFVQAFGDRFYEWTGAPHTSNITEIDLDHSAVTPEHLANLLVGIKSLKLFTYHHDVQLAQGHGMEGQLIIEALLEHASHSLEFLCLTGRYTVYRASEGNKDRSLRDFKVLKEVFLPGAAYLTLGPWRGPKPDGGFHREDFQLVYLLPPSIEEIYLDYSIRGLGHSSGFLDHFPEEKDRRLPNLKFVAISDHESPSQSEEESAKACVEMCEKLGVTLRLSWDGSNE